MRVVVTGATGFIGRAFLGSARERLELRGVYRSDRHLLPGVDWVRFGGMTPTTDWRGVLRDADAVLHLAGRAHTSERGAKARLEHESVNLDGTRRLALAAVEAGVRRFVFISTIGVHGRSSRTPITEASAIKPAGSYAASKWNAEESLQRLARESGLEVVIVRPPLVYGPHAPGNFGRLAALVRAGVPIPVGSVRNRRSLVYIGNLVNFFEYCLTKSEAAGHVFVVADGDDVSTPDLVRRMARHLQRSARIWPFPPTVLSALARASGKAAMADGLIGSLPVDASHARRVLDWTPPYTLDEGLAASLDPV